MSERFDQLTARRRALLERSTSERETVVSAAAALQSTLAPIDRTIVATRRVLTTPVTVTGALALILLIGPKRVVQGASRIAALWPLLRGLLGARN